MGIDSVKHVILILSGKGGVGKSTVSCELAVSLQELGHKVMCLLCFCTCSSSSSYLVMFMTFTQARSNFIHLFSFFSLCLPTLLQLFIRSACLILTSAAPVCRECLV